MQIERKAEKIHESFESIFHMVDVFQTIGTCDKQEDAYWCRLGKKSAIMVVCDGMGGMAEGRLAAETAIEAIQELSKEIDWEVDCIEFIKKAIICADDRVARLTDTEGKRLQGGCTLVLAVIIGRKLFWGNVGDSRINLFTKKEIKQLTIDHNYGARLERYLQEGRMTEEQYQKELSRAAALTSYIGVGGVPEQYVSEEPYLLEQEDIVMVQSDGLYKILAKEEMREILSLYSRDFEKAGSCLMGEAKKRIKSYQDNTTFILAKMK